MKAVHLEIVSDNQSVFLRLSGGLFHVEATQHFMCLVVYSSIRELRLTYIYIRRTISVGLAQAVSPQ